MAYNDTPSVKVPAFPDQFQECIEPVRNPTNVGLFMAHQANGTILNTAIAVKEEIDTEVAGFPRAHRDQELVSHLCCVACSFDP